MRSPSVWAVLPAKCFARGKSRLGGALDDSARERLARGLFDRALGVLLAAPRIGGVVVATDCALVAARARRRGALALVGAAPLRASVDAALGVLAGAGARSALVMMSDLPRVEPADVARMARLLDGHDLVVAPDERDEGTNALGLHLRGGAPVTCFGHADSFARHLARARAAGVYRDARVGFDVDLPRDLRKL